MKPNIFVLLSTCMEVPISLSCFTRLLVHELPYQTVECVAILFFALVLRAWTSVLFSMLQWGLLKLFPTIIFESLLCSNIFIYHKCLFTSAQNSIHIRMHFNPLNDYIFYSHL